MNRQTDAKNILLDQNYFHYLAQYQGNVSEEFTKYPQYYVTIINENYLILSLPEMIDIINQKVKFTTVINIKPSVLYTLEQISPAEASNVGFVQTNSNLNLTGKNVYMVIVDTGIDYLSEEFMDSNGNTRIEFIWDQTLPYSSNHSDKFTFPFGAIYTSEDIQNAINFKNSGGDPYTIVPSNDEIGHGTQMAGLIGATGKNPTLKGIAYECKFIIIKLLRDTKLEEIYNSTVPAYNLTVLLAALNFLYIYYLSTANPILIYFPLGTSLAAHNGSSPLEAFINYISSNGLITVVTGAGNERDAFSHASGIVTEENPTGIVELNVPPEQKSLICEIWAKVPNIFTIDIVSPSGENTGELNYVIDSTLSYTFVFEKTNIKINYYVPEVNSGTELIRIEFFNLQPGIWKLQIIGKLIIGGGYDIWLPTRGITRQETQLSPADPYGTFTIPASSRSTVTAAGYNQTNNNIVGYSGMTFKNQFADTLDVAAGSVNAMTIAPNNQIVTVNGTSVSAAILAGACALLFQWGIVDKNYPAMYSQAIKTFIARGVTLRPGDQYPNPQWGYGILNILELFQNIT